VGDGATGLGFPSGKNKRWCSILTASFVRRTARLRLKTNMEIYWTPWSGPPVGPTPKSKPFASIPKPPSFAIGASRFSQANPSSPEQPDYDRIATTSQKWRDLIGYYTRFGDIRELLEKVDDRIVIVNAGDEMAFRFPARRRRPPAGARLRSGRGWLDQGRRL